MSGVDYGAVRALVSMADVLDLLEFSPFERSGGRLRGPCPVHAPAAQQGRSFSVDPEKGLYICFSCGSSGNQLDLWAAVTGLPLNAAAQDFLHEMRQSLFRKFSPANLLHLNSFPVE